MREDPAEPVEPAKGVGDLTSILVWDQEARVVVGTACVLQLVSYVQTAQAVVGFAYRP